MSSINITLDKSTQTDPIYIIQIVKKDEKSSTIHTIEKTTVKQLTPEEIRKQREEEEEAWIEEHISFGGGNGPIHSASGPSYEPGAFPYAPAKPSTDPRPPPWLSTTIEPTSNRKKPVEIAFARWLQQPNK